MPRAKDAVSILRLGAEFLTSSVMEHHWHFPSPTDRALIAVGASLGLHTLLFFLFDGYRQLVFRVGWLFPHGHDIADIGVVGGTGFAVSAVAVVGVGLFFERLLRM